MLLIGGLGNKGKAYEHTRHNVGYLVLDRFSERFRISLSKKVAGCTVGMGDLNGTVLLAKPDTYMNLSGGPLSSLMKRKAVSAEDLLIIHDDLDMDFGRIKFRWNGGDGGHRGVRSVIEQLGTAFFHRIKIGIGRDPNMPPEEFVLSRFRSEERKRLDEVLDKAVDALDVFVREGKEKAMNLFNR